MRVIKVGLIGCGRIMPAHLHGYKALSEKNVDVRIAALCGRKIDDAKRFRRQGEGPLPRKPVGPPGDPLAVPHIHVYDFQTGIDVGVYDHCEEMLKGADIDAVEIYTSVSSHHQIALASLEAGKHVLVEKPFAVTVKAGRRMVQAAEKAGKVLGVAENARYFPETRMVRWTVEEGFIGDVQMVVAGGIGGYWSPRKIVAETAWRHKKMLGGGGATIDMGVHLFQILRYLVGEVDEVSSCAKTIEKERVTLDEAGKIMERVDSEVDDTFFSLVKFRGEPTGQVFFSWAGHGESVSIPRTIYGSRGCIKGEKLMLDDGTKTDVKTLFEEKASERVREEFFPKGLRDPMALETLEFLRAIEEGREMETSGREGLRDLAASYAMLESSLLGRSVKVDDVESGRLGRYQEEINVHYGI